MVNPLSKQGPSYQILTLQGLSMYSSGDDERTDAIFCASTLCPRIFAPHDALAKFFRRLPFFVAPVAVAVCWTFVGEELPLDTLAKCASEDTLLRLAMSPLPRRMEIDSMSKWKRRRRT